MGGLPARLPPAGREARTENDAAGRGVEENTAARLSPAGPQDDAAGRGMEEKRILQVCKWMLARGQGRTFGTYDLMMEAMATTGRHAELDGTWERIMGRHLDTVPRATFARVMSLYTQQGRPLKVLEVYGSMIELGVNVDEGNGVWQYDRAGCEPG
ncbi:unnamed protein product [Closterium sp. Naga37s-1]|nr:unnamed protein product [Closterium sp. Naga37s-1]